MSIYPAKNRHGAPTGTYVVQVTREGRTVTKRTRDIKEARLIEAHLIAGQLPASQPAKAVSYTVQDLLVDARKLYRGTKDEHQSIQRLETSLGIIGHHKPVSTISLAELDKLAKELAKRQLSPASINRHLMPVSKALRWAVEHDHISRKPKVPKVAEGPGRETYLSEADEPRFLDWLANHNRGDVAGVCRALLSTGFRIQELLDLEPNDITPNGWARLRVGTTKNNLGRTVYLGIDEAASLRAFVERGLPGYRRILDAMQAASVALGIDMITPHVLRHTVATRLNTKGVPTATIMKLLGHASVATTLRYAHVEPEALKAASELLRRTG